MFVTMPGYGKIFSIGRADLGVGLVGYILFGRENGVDTSLFLGAAWLAPILSMLALVGGSLSTGTVVSITACATRFLARPAPGASVGFL